MTWALHQDEPHDPPASERILHAVAIAALTTIAAGLADWFVDELREKYGRAKLHSKPEGDR